MPAVAKARHLVNIQTKTLLKDCINFVQVLRGRKTGVLKETFTIDKADPSKQPANALRGPYLSPIDDNMI